MWSSCSQRGTQDSVCLEHYRGGPIMARGAVLGPGNSWAICEGVRDGNVPLHQSSMSWTGSMWGSAPEQPVTDSHSVSHREIQEGYTRSGPSAA